MNPNEGGVSKGIRNTIPELNRLGVTNEVACLNSPGSDELWDDSFTIHCLGPSKSSWAYSPLLRPWLATNLSRFDAVILNGLWQYPAMATRKACLSRGTPYYVMPHGMLDPWFQRDPSRRIKAIRNWFYWKGIEHKTIRDAEAVLFTCETEKLLAREPFRPYRPKKEITVGYGIEEPPKESPREKEELYNRCPALKDQTYLLFLSRIHPKKGLDLLIQAYASLRDAVASDKLQVEREPFPKLVIAGPGLETPYGKRCLELCQSLGLPTRIPTENTKASSTSCPLPLHTSHSAPGPAAYFLGMVDGPLKWGCLRNAEAFVLPSHQENFGIAVVEALACGTPVLISDQVNIWREIERDGAAIVGKDNLSGTTSLLRDWHAQSEDTKNRMSRNSQASFRTHFSIEMAAKKFIRSIEPADKRTPRKKEEAAIPCR